MIKNVPIFLISAMMSQSFGTKEIPKLSELCGQTLILGSEISEESKAYVNTQIGGTRLKDAFDFSGQTIINNPNLAGLHLNQFNFENAKLIDLSLKDSILHDATFDKTVFRNVDFSGTDLKTTKFTNCKFIDCNLEGCNLTDIILDGCKFKRCKLNRVILGEEVIFDEAKSDLNQVLLYRDYIELGELKKAKALNKLFAIHKLNLKNADLRNLNLNGINLEKSALQYAQLDGVRLSDSLVLPEYGEDVELIRFYSKLMKSEREKDAQTLNTILPGLHIAIDSEQEKDENLRNLDLTGINLENSDLWNANLTGTILIKANLKNASLDNAVLKDTNLKDANLKYTNLDTDLNIGGIRLNGVILSDTLTLNFNDISELFYKLREDGPDQYLYQKLFNARVPMLEDISQEVLKEMKWQEMNLRNVNFKDVTLEEIDFSDCNLKKAYFVSIGLKNVKFINANLKKTCFNCVEHIEADFTNANLTKAYLYFSASSVVNVNFRKAWLSKNFQIDYKENINELFYKWAKNDSNRPFCEKLIQMGCPILVDILTNDLEKVNWQGLDLNHAFMKNLCFKDIEFRDVNFSKSEFANVSFKNCNFVNVDFHDAKLDAKFDDCFFDQTTFSYDYQLARFNKFNFKNFKNIKLSNPYITFNPKEKVCGPELLDNYSRFISNYNNIDRLSLQTGYMLFITFLKDIKLDLSGADLRNLNLQGITLTGANLVGADLSGSNLRGADLRGSNLREANLTDCNLSQALLDDTIGRFSEGYNGSFVMELMRELQSTRSLVANEESNSEEPLIKRLKTE